MSAAVDMSRYFKGGMPGGSNSSRHSAASLHADSVLGGDGDDGDVSMSVPSDSYYSSGGAFDSEFKASSSRRRVIDDLLAEGDDDSPLSGGIGLPSSYSRSAVDSDSRVPLYSADKGQKRGRDDFAPASYGLGVPSAAKRQKRTGAPMSVGALPGKPRQLPGSSKTVGFTGGGFDSAGPYGALRRPGFTGVTHKATLFADRPDGKGGINRHAGDILLEMLSPSAENRHTRGLKGTGRGQPQSQQSPISIAIYGNKNQFKERKSNRPEEMTAPIGTAACHNFEPGEIALCKWTNNRAGAFDVEGYTSWDVTTTINGMRHDDLYFVAGLIKTAQRLDDSNSSEVSAALFSGTGTTTHEGWKPIFAGDTVLVSLTPNYMYDELGNPMPTISQEGRPSDKFVPATYRMDEQTVGAQAAQACECVDSALNKVLDLHWDTKNNTIKGGAMVAFSGEVKTNLENRYRDRACFGDVHPIRQYGQWYAVSVALGMPLMNLVEAAKTKELKVSMTKVLEMIKTAITHRDRNRDIRDQNFLIIPDIDDSRDTEVRDFADAVSKIKDRENPLYIITSGLWRIIARLSSYAQRQMQHCLQEMHFYLRRMALGTAMGNAAPGHALDVAIKIF